jgi:hypothetical protein
MANEASSKVKVPRIAIEFCTQCKWNLRAAYVSAAITFCDIGVYAEATFWLSRGVSLALGGIC